MTTETYAVIQHWTLSIVGVLMVVCTLTLIQFWVENASTAQPECVLTEGKQFCIDYENLEVRDAFDER